MSLSPPILIIGEAWGAEEAKLGAAFVGSSGSALLRMLASAGVIVLSSDDKACLNNAYTTGDPTWVNKVWDAHVHELYRTNVFNQRPPDNDITWFCGGRADAIDGYPILQKSKYVRAEFEPELDRLAAEILDRNPNVVLCLGNTALWALGGKTGIKNWRGTTFESTHTVAGYKCLATYHPSAVLRGWDLRPIAVADLIKARNESEYPEIRRPKREIWIEPTLEDIETFIKDYIDGSRPLSVDIETTGNRITCIGLGFSTRAIVIPFDDGRAAKGCYWPTELDERLCWNMVRSVLEDASIPKLFQNGLYDIAFLWRSMRVKVLGAEADTMLLHHALQPEMIKDLGFLGSVYAEEAAWKHLGKRTRTIKRDA